ncbi:hypothetical protein [Clostridium senegalense]|uniref:hypothetical protein n=1 Tax=Clostridium senegalense TaxID=1465809 RepID=UPI0002885EDF|nr:hypothetical protein [Clostridium senegalense]
MKLKLLGTMERNICDAISQRMRGSKINWFISGVDNLAKILFVVFIDRLSNKSILFLCNKYQIKRR